MQDYFLCGIQQIGLGNSSVYDTWEWYRKHLGMDIPIFDEAAETKLMLPYTGQEVRSRHAVLALNFGGGGGMEIWQYKLREPKAANFEIQFSDYGILCAKFKTPDIHKLYQYFLDHNLSIISDISDEVFGLKHFYAKDDFGNLIELVESEDFYKIGSSLSGGVLGATLGVSDMQESIRIFQEILGYDTILGEYEGPSEDIANVSSKEDIFHRVLLTHKEKRKGPFSKLLGPSIIELVQCKNKIGRRVFENRFWGDLGYIHLCFDVIGMDSLKQKCHEMGYSFTVDSSNSFDMGEAAGRFSYIETKEGILLEFVETHKVPILKKFGWYLDLRKRNQQKALPAFMLRALALNRKKTKVN